MGSIARGRLAGEPGVVAAPFLSASTGPLPHQPDLRASPSDAIPTR
jgi:hypothetical protein